MAVEYIEEKILAVGDRTGLVVHRPKELIEGKKYPLIIFHPGIGERGAGTEATLEQLRANGSVLDLELKSKDYEFITIEVQPRNNYEHGETDEGYEWAKQQYGDKINWAQVYLTGLSLGGGGVQRYLSVNANAHEKFAAAVINCPGPNQYFVVDYNKLVNTKVPMWFFHNSGDKTVTPAQSTLLTEQKIKELRGTAQYRITIYNRDGHTWPSYSFGKGYKAATATIASMFNNPAVNIYEWMLMNQVGKSAVMPPVLGEAPLPIPTDPVVIPDPIVVEPIPTVPTTPAPVYIRGINVGGDNRFSMATGSSAVVEVFWEGINEPTRIKAPADKSDRITGVWTTTVDGKLKVVIDWSVKPNEVIGPVKK